MSSARVLKLTILTAVGIALLMTAVFALGNTAGALSNWEPHEPDFTTSPEQWWAMGGTRNMRFVTDKSGAQAWKSVVAIYTRTTAVSVTVIDAVHCDDNSLFTGVGGDYDGLSGITTNFSLETYSPAAGSTFGAVEAVTDCNGGGSRDITIVRDISSDPQPVVIGGITWYRSKLRADMSTAAAGSNTFEVVANNAGALVSYYSQSGNDFVLQDRGGYDGGSPPRINDYRLTFGTECDFDLANNPVRVEWYDDDHPGNNSDPRFNYRMELIERPRSGGSPTTYYLNNDGTMNFAATPGWTGNQNPSWAEFNAKLDHTYEWIWHGVQKNNAIQFQLPFDSIYYDYGCPTDDWDYTPAIAANKATIKQGETVTLTHTTTHSGTNDGPGFLRSINVTSGDAKVDKSTNWENDVGLQAKQDATSAITVGSSSSRSANYTAKADAEPGQVCFNAGINTTRDGNEYSADVCVTIEALPIWDYQPSVQALEDRYPGEEFDVISDVVNTGEIEGLKFDHQIHSWEGEANLDVVDLGADPWDNDARWTGVSALAASGGATSNTGRWKVKTTAIPGTEICFRSSATPARGNSLVTLLGQRFGPAVDEDGVCFKVKENRRFSMTSAVAKKVSTGIVVPGGTAVFTVVATNNGTGISDRGNVADYYTYIDPSDGSTQSYMVAGPAHSISCSFSTTGPAAGGPVLDSDGTTVPSCTKSDPARSETAINTDVRVNVSDTANLGDQVCLEISGGSLNGFSDGTDLSSALAAPFGPADFTDYDCYDVGIQPYLQVNYGDVWAGANFDPESEDPLSRGTCGGTTNNDAEIRSVVSGVAGSHVTYAALATGDISGFGSDGNPNWDSLTFANNVTPNGHYTNSPKCIFDYYGVMSQVQDNTVSGKVNINSLKDTEQSYAASSIEIDGGNNYQKRASVVVNGDVSITGNIEFDTKYKPGLGADFIVPSLVIVAKGNIYIDQSVTQIDAVLISHGDVDAARLALGDTGIWTCSNGYTPVMDVAANVCTETLTINGALIANRVNFMRTHEGGASANKGGVHLDPAAISEAGPAEIINFLPEFYLSEPVFKTINPSNWTIELFKDLPPVY